MDLKITVDLDHAKNLMVQFPAAARAAQIARITEAALLAEGVIKQHTPVGAGPIHLRDTIFHQINSTGQNVWGMVSTPAQYALPVEMGTKPHFPPVAPIQHWVERKLGYSGKEAHAIAFLIARAISRRGTKAQKMFTLSYQELEMRILRILNMIPDDIVRNILKN